MHPEEEVDAWFRFPPVLPAGRAMSRRWFFAAGAIAAASAFAPLTFAQRPLSAGPVQTRFKRISTQFIAALAAPGATTGDNAHLWGLWRRDPGPRGVTLDRYERLENGGIAPAGWKFDGQDWWLEEHGLIMEQPEFPMPPGKYLVTGDRDVTTVLTVDAMAPNGTQHWALDGGATVYDVTHLRCRSARYTPASSRGACSPAYAKASDFPVAPGGVMPPVENCDKQDYAVLILIGVAESG